MILNANFKWQQLHFFFIIIINYDLLMKIMKQKAFYLIILIEFELFCITDEIILIDF